MVRGQKATASKTGAVLGFEARLLDDAMTAIERENASLKGMLPKNYARQDLDKTGLGKLIDVISNIGLGDSESRSRDLLGRVYEYFLSQFASAEGKKGGEFYTPRCIVRLLVEIRTHGHVLTPGRYVGAEAQEADGEPFEEKMRRLTAELRRQIVESRHLEALIENQMRDLGY